MYLLQDQLLCILLVLIFYVHIPKTHVMPYMVCLFFHTLTQNKNKTLHFYNGIYFA